MKKLLILIWVTLGYQAVQAQQKPQFSQYMINNYLLNPAITGIEEYTNVKLGYREQWIGLEDAPQSYYMTMHGSIGKAPTKRPIPRPRPGVRKRRRTSIPQQGMGKGSGRLLQTRMTKPHHGLGGAILFDKTGPLKNTSVNASYAIHVPITRTIRASAGLAAGVMAFQFDPSQIHTAVANDPTLNIPVVKETLLDLTVGTWVYSDRFFTGVSLPQIARNRRDLTDFSRFDGSFALQQHIYLTGGYKFFLDREGDFAVIPSAMVKLASPSPVSVDLNARVIFRDMIWAGTSYRYQDAAIVMVGFNFNHVVEAGYSYDATTSELNKVSAGSHEIMVGFKLFNPNKVICPHWMW